VSLGIAAPESISILRQELCFDQLDEVAVAKKVNHRCDDHEVSFVRKSR
jgi:sRNA-binding carbon storage regulator CsrA